MKTQLSPCPACHAPLDEEFTVGSIEDLSFIACENCGTVVTDPMPTEAELDSLFANFTPADVKDEPGQIVLASKLIKPLMQMVRGRRFLDVNSQRGYAVKAATNLDLKAKGIDQREFFANFAQKRFPDCHFEMASTKAYAAQGEQADIIFCAAAFCQQTNPEAFTAGLAELLADKGIIYIEEPDGNHYMLPRKFEKWSFVDPPFNFVYYSKNGLKALLARHGLKITKSRFSFFSPFMRLIVQKA